MELNAVDRVRCEERSGFLFRHKCLNAPTVRCDSCGKPACAEHVGSVEWPVLRQAKLVHPEAAEPAATARADAPPAMVCVTCDKAVSRSLKHDPGAHAAEPGPDDPYWYGDRYYHGFGHFGPGQWGHVLLRAAAAGGS